MKIKVTSVYVDDQDKALRFYTEVLGFAKKTDFSQGPYRWLTVASPEEPDGTQLQLALNNNPAAKAYQPGDFSTAPTCGQLLHRLRQGRLRAHQGPWRRVHDAAYRRDWLDHRHAERHLRQPHSAHPARTLVGRTFSREKVDDRSRAVHTGSGQRGAVLPILVRSCGCSRSTPLGQHVGTGSRHDSADSVPDCTDCNSPCAQQHCARWGSDCPQLDLSSTGALPQRS